MRFACILENVGSFRVTMMCRLLKVSKAGFYAWRDRAPSQRSQNDAHVLTRIRNIHSTSHETYGSPRICAQMHRDGVHISKKRVARLMKKAGLAVKIRRRYKATTNSKHSLPIAPNVLQRRFDVDEIATTNRVWAGDITYVWTLEGWLYLAVVLDLRSRRVIGWSMSQSMERGLVIDALKMALSRRQPGAGVLHHSDRGSQYASADCRALLQANEMTSSMSRKGNCWDNAVVESFNATIKTELIHRTVWTTREEARAAIYKYIETWYNSMRLHSTLGYCSPVEFENNESDKAA
jgi:transposase InsO family protein